MSNINQLHAMIFSKFCKVSDPNQALIICRFCSTHMHENSYHNQDAPSYADHVLMLLRGISNSILCNHRRYIMTSPGEKSALNSYIGKERTGMRYKKGSFFWPTLCLRRWINL